jgi:hypothetical protein
MLGGGSLRPAIEVFLRVVVAPAWAVFWGEGPSSLRPED